MGFQERFFCDLTRALETLELLGNPGRHDCLMMAALETGGYFKLPLTRRDPARSWDSQRVEIKAHGVFAEGGDEAEAIHNWMRAARAQARILKQVDQAEALLRLPEHETTPETRRSACRTIIEHGPVGATLRAARATLDQMGAAA